MSTTPESMLAEARGTMPLAPGQRLGDFLITRIVGQGGFGIVYEAEDLTLQRRVAIKEYMPAQLASRIDGTVNPVSGRYAKTFDLGRRSFLAEARLLAQFRHPGLLEVLHFWEQNGTAYMVMPFYEGRTLDQVLANGAHVVTESWLKSMIRPVLDALEHMHGEDCYHRDVSADNILIRDDGKALLLDLGAARRVIGESDRALTVMLKPGYAPIEQYADDPACRQGPWTDIYAVAAVLYFAVANRMPPASASRVMHDTLPPLASLAPAGYGRRFLEAIDRGLSIRPEHRPRTVGEFRSLLFAATPETGLIGSARARIEAAEADAPEAAFEDADASAPGLPSPSARWTLPSPWLVAGVAALVAAAIGWFSLGGEGETVPTPAVATAATSGAATTRATHDDAPSREPAVATDPFASRATSSQPPDPGVAATDAIDAAASPVAARAETNAAPPEAAGQTGVVRLSIAPWGEVYVDGVARGVTPPLKQLQLDAGRRRIEVRNPSGPAWTKDVVVVAGERITLSHRFP